MGVQLVSVGAFGTEMAARDGRLGITLDGNQLATFVIDKLSAADSTVRTDRSRDLGVLILGAQVPGALAHGLCARTVGACSNLLDHGPAKKQIFEHSLPPCTSSPKHFTQTRSTKSSDDTSRPGAARKKTVWRGRPRPRNSHLHVASSMQCMRSRPRENVRIVPCCPSSAGKTTATCAARKPGQE